MNTTRSNNEHISFDVFNLKHKFFLYITTQSNTSTLDLFVYKLGSIGSYQVMRLKLIVLFDLGVFVFLFDTKRYNTRQYNTRKDKTRRYEIQIEM